MFVKVCGIKNFNELRMVEKFADATGVVVKSNSRRSIDLQHANKIIANSRIPVFAVSTEDTYEGWMDLVDITEADHIQVHSDISAVEFEKLRDNFEGKISKAFKIPQRCDNTEREVEEMISKMSGYDCDYFLLDTGNGSGKLHDLRVSKGVVENIGKREIILAGGLNPINLPEIIRYVRPFGVDVSSGVERNGSKDEQLVKEFVEVLK